MYFQNMKDCIVLGDIERIFKTEGLFEDSKLNIKDDI